MPCRRLRVEIGMGLGIKKSLVAARRRASRTVEGARQKMRPILGRPGARVLSVYQSTTDMCDTDRIYLYALIRGIRPTSCVEIGTRWGGSARIICAALEDNGQGQLVGIDPAPGAFLAPKRALHNRFRLVEGFSPQDVPRAVEGMGPIDFALIDGMHTYHSVCRDLEGLRPFLAQGAHVLMHDAHHVGILRAADEFLARHPESVDMGMVTRSPKFTKELCYQGFRLIRYGSNLEQVIREGYARCDAPFPADPDYYLDYDRYALREGLVELSDDGYRWVRGGESDHEPKA